MKKLLMFLGGIFLIILILLIAAVGYAVLSGIGQNLDAESKLWVDTVVPEIVATWNVEALLKNSSSALLQTVSEEEMVESLDIFSEQLGAMKQYHGSTGAVSIYVRNGIKTITAEYVSAVTFENSSSTIEITGVKENDVWKVNRIYINMPLEADQNVLDKLPTSETSDGWSGEEMI